MNQSQQMQEAIGEAGTKKNMMKFANQLMTAFTRLDVSVNAMGSDVSNNLTLAMNKLDGLTSDILGLVKKEQ